MKRKSAETSQGQTNAFTSDSTLQVKVVRIKVVKMHFGITCSPKLHLMHSYTSRKLGVWQMANLEL